MTKKMMQSFAKFVDSDEMSSIRLLFICHNRRLNKVYASLIYGKVLA